NAAPPPTVTPPRPRSARTSRPDHLQILWAERAVVLALVTAGLARPSYCAGRCDAAPQDGRDRSVPNIRQREPSCWPGRPGGRGADGPGGGGQLLVVQLAVRHELAARR